MVRGSRNHRKSISPRLRSRGVFPAARTEWPMREIAGGKRRHQRESSSCYHCGMEGRRTTCQDFWELVFHSQWAGFVWFQFSTLALFCPYFFLVPAPASPQPSGASSPEINDTWMDITTTLYNLHVCYWNLCPFLHTLVYFVNRNIK